jgi:signal peptide peptidase SppA
MNPDTQINRADHGAIWAIQPETMPILASLMRRGLNEISAEEREAMLRRAATGDTRAVTGQVAVISLRGIITPRASFLSLLFGIGGGGLVSFQQLLTDAVNDGDVGAIVIEVDSPGGRVDLVPETAAMVREVRAVKPIVAVANTLTASAAYWIASQADELVVTPSGQVGSIGVFVAHEDWSRFDEQMGIRTTLISAGKYKTEGNPFEPLTASAREAFQQMVDETYDLFVADVAAGRGVDEAAVRAGYGEGRVLNASRAVEEGLADSVETLDEVISRLVGGDGGTPARALSAATAIPAPGADAPGPTPEAEAETDTETETDPVSPSADEMTDEDRSRIAAVFLG